MRRDRHNAAAFVLGDSTWGLQASLVASATVLTVFLQNYGAGPRMIAVIPAVETGATLLLGVFGLRLFAAGARRKRRLIGWHLAAAVPFLLLMSLFAGLADRLGSNAVRWAVLVSFGGYVAALGVAVPGWVDWFAHVFTARNRGTVMGLAAGGYALTGTVGGLLAGYVLRVVPAPAAYGWLYLASAVLGAAAMGLYWQVDDAAATGGTEAPPPGLRAILRSVRASMGDRDFLWFLVGRMLAVAGFSMVPFIAVHYTSVAGGGLSDSRVVTYGAALAVGMACATLLLGRLGDRHGHRLGLIIGVIAQVVTLAVLLGARGGWSCLLAYTMTGISAGSGIVSHFNLLLESCRHDDRLAHIAIGNLVIGVVAVIAPVLGGAVAATWGLPRLFAICLGLSVVALAWHLLLMRDPRASPAHPAVAPA